MQQARISRVADETVESGNTESTGPSTLVNSNTKVGKLIRQLRDNVTPRNIVLLLLEIAEKPEICVDFDIKLHSYLNMFLQCQEDAVLSEAGHLVLSAAKIYSRRVDHIQECIEKIISGMDKGIRATEEGQRRSAARQKRAIKRPRTEQDPLYEAEIAPKQLKIVALTKTTEVLSSLSTFEAPKHFFKQWRKYKEWRAQYKKKMKCPIPYSTLDDNVSLHPSLWKLSCIEDFDYEDDVDTKRNYRVFTNYIEHRHSTLVNDINFIMHFKVKDFIEAEEDEIEIMNMLGLPPPPKRKWPPICKAARVEEKDPDGSTLSSEDYINNYLQLENALLENEHCDLNYQELFEEYQNNIKETSQNGTCNSVQAKNLTEVILINKTNEIPQDRNVCDTIQTLPETTDIDKNQCHINNQSENVSLSGTQSSQIEKPLPELSLEYTAPDVSLVNTSSELSLENTKPVSCEKQKNLVDTNINASNLPVSKDCNVSEDKIAESESHCVDISEKHNEAAANKSIKAMDISEKHNETAVSKSMQAVDILEKHNETAVNNSIKAMESCLDNNCIRESESFQDSIFCENIIDISLNNDLLHEKFLNNNNIIIRLSVDEGVALSDLDEVDRAMLSPVVELVDILKPIMSNALTPTDLVFHADEPMCNLFGIDEALLTFNQDFTLPIDTFLSKEEIKINILKIPEHVLRKKSRFNLPQDFSLFKKDRCKRKHEAAKVEKKIKLYKLNDGKIRGDILTPPPSPCMSDDFLGFGESSLFPESDVTDGRTTCKESDNTNIFNTETSPGKANRSFSRDSGIGISVTEIQNSFLKEICHDDSFINTTDINQSQSLDNTYLGNPVLQSTAIENDILNNDVEHAPETSQNHPQLEDNHSSTEPNPSQSEKNPSPSVAVVDKERTVNTSSPDLFEENSSDCNNYNQETIPHASHQDPTERNVVDLNVIIDKVQKWHRYLKPILNQSKDRHHFDVFEIGTEIIDKFSEAEAVGNRTVSFEDVMREKDPSYISRYFLSSLLLANQNNISLQVVDTNKEEPVPLSKIELTLESKIRHNVSIEDDIGSTTVSRQRVPQPETDSQSTSDQSEFIIDVSAEPSMTLQDSFIRENNQREVLMKYRITNRDLLAQEVKEHRDDYIRVLSRKYDIDLGLYFTEEEIRRLQTEDIRRDFESACLIYPKNINIRKNCSKNADDSDSGFHSHNTTESFSAVT